MSLLGIDIGTTGCKAAAFAEDGRRLSYAYREYPTQYPKPGWAEVDSALVWSLVRETVAAAASEAKRDPVTALCVSSMGEAATPVSLKREILGSAILCSDDRGEEYVAKLRDALGDEGFYRINPNILSTSYSLPKLAWRRDHEPELYRKAERFILFDGLLGFMAGCDPFVSFSGANRTLLFDIRKEDWSEKLLSVAGLDRAKLPRCLPGGAVAGTVSASGAKLLGIPAGVKVVVGGHDQCCNALGAGVVQAGHSVDGIGTFECIAPFYAGIPEPAKMLALGLNVEHHVLPGLYASFLYNQAGSLVKWFRDTFAQTERDQEGIYDRLTAEMPPQPTDLYVLPYFEPSGSPGFVSDASGVITGLRPSTKRGEILKATMESVTYYFTESIDSLSSLGIDTSEFVATGGGAKSDAWLQIKADILGKPYVRLSTTEAGLAGAAMLAGLGTGVYATAQQAVERFVKRGRVFEPDLGRHTLYRERGAHYRRLLPAVRGFLAGARRIGK